MTEEVSTARLQELVGRYKELVLKLRQKVEVSEERVKDQTEELTRLREEHAKEGDVEEVKRRVLTAACARSAADALGRVSLRVSKSGGMSEFVLVSAGVPKVAERGEELEEGAERRVGMLVGRNEWERVSSGTAAGEESVGTLPEYVARDVTGGGEDHSEDDMAAAAIEAEFAAYRVRAETLLRQAREEAAAAARSAMHREEEHKRSDSKPKPSTTSGKSAAELVQQVAVSAAPAKDSNRVEELRLELSRERTSFATYRKRAVDTLREREDQLTALEREVGDLRRTCVQLRQRAETAESKCAQAQAVSRLSASRAPALALTQILSSTDEGEPLPASARGLLRDRLLYLRHLVLRYMTATRTHSEDPTAMLTSLFSPKSTAASSDTLAEALATVLDFNETERDTARLPKPTHGASS